jgi:LPS export ABC transporter permease LptG
MNSALQSYSVIFRFIPALVFAVVGGLASAYLAPLESVNVADQLAGFPDSHAAAHNLRPIVLSIICFIPTLGALYYGLCRSLDQYLIRQFLGAFCLCLSSLFAIWFISDLTGKVGDFRESNQALEIATQYYLASLPKVFVEFAPFGLLLALLLCLGKLSQGQEIVSMIQTGRGVPRLIFPFIIMGLLVSLICLGFNYRWAPWSESYREGLIEKAKEGEASQARNVVYYEKDHRRLWWIGSFPDNYHKGAPLQQIIVRTFDEEGKPTLRLEAESAEWNRETTDWTFRGVNVLHLDETLDTDRSQLMPRYELNLPDVLVYQDWPETPWQLIKPGLTADSLGIPGLYSWLLANDDLQWGNKRGFLTQWHYRWAQPGICLAIVLLAAPLGIVFSRRGTAGGIALAIFLSAGIMFSSTVFLALGESGYLHPALAAWGTNIVATSIALILIQRRLVGRPIYQTLRKLLPSSILPV